MNYSTQALMKKRETPRKLLCAKHDTKLVRPHTTDRGAAYKSSRSKKLVCFQCIEEDTREASLRQAPAREH